MKTKKCPKNNKMFFLAMVINFVLFAVLLSGCGAENNAKSTQDQSPTPSAEKKISYPEKPINVVIGFNPGGGHDNNARILGKYFEKEFGVPLTFVYKPGANGAIGLSEVAQAKADGYTITVHGYQDMVIPP